MTGAPPIRVITLADERYAMPLATMGRSLLEHHRSGRALLLKVIDGGMSPATRERVERSWQGAAPSPATWEWVAPQFGEGRSLPVWGRVPILTYARLFLDAYFEACEGRVVLLDSDTLVLRDIAELHDSELDDNVIGACEDPFIPTMSAVDAPPPFLRPGIPDDAPYFNGGILVADLARWREQQVGPRSLAYIDHAFPHLRQYDQDPLNIQLFGKWKQLDARWNVQPRAENALGLSVPQEPFICHFSGRLKPWTYSGRAELDRRYLEYVQRTDWKGFRSPSHWQARLLRLYDSPVRRVLHGIECRLIAVYRDWIAKRPTIQAK